MYESFYGLKEKPFNLTPDPDFFFMSQVHENAYTHLEYALTENKGFVVITGEIGSGKTTLINFLLRNIPEDMEIGIINHTNILPARFLRMICQEFEVDVNSRSKIEKLEALHRFLLQMFSQGKRVVLIIDEAQNLPPITLEEIRMLSNLESEKHHLIQIILSGQPELKAKLKQKNLAQLAQRVTVYCHLGGLGREEVKQYIHHRLQVAGAENTDIFNEDALDAVHRNSKGIPRVINRLCDTALVYGFAEERKNIDAAIIEEVMKAGEITETPADSAGAMDAPSRAVSREKVGSRQGNEEFRSLNNRMETLETSLKALIHEIKEARTQIDGLARDVREFMMRQQQHIGERIEKESCTGTKIPSKDNTKTILSTFMSLFFRKKR